MTIDGQLSVDGEVKTDTTLKMDNGKTYNFKCIVSGYVSLISYHYVSGIQ